jgi:hypothetical protein
MTFKEELREILARQLVDLAQRVNLHQDLADISGEKTGVIDFEDKINDKVDQILSLIKQRLSVERIEKIIWEWVNINDMHEIGKPKDLAKVIHKEMDCST